MTLRPRAPSRGPPPRLLKPLPMRHLYVCVAEALQSRYPLMIPALCGDLVRPAYSLDPMGGANVYSSSPRPVLSVSTG